MTLLCCAKMDNDDGVLVAVDTVLGGAGYRWDAGPKLFVVQPRADCALIFEGSTELAYPLAINALNFLSLSDHLSNPDDTDPTSVEKRIEMEVQAAYNGIKDQICFDPKIDNCSFLFVGWSSKIRTSVLHHMRSPVKKEDPWAFEDLDDNEEWKSSHAFFAGSGDREPVKSAWAHFREQTEGSPARRAYNALLHVIDDKNETAVGGAPQIAIAGPSGFHIYGINENGHRTLLGCSVRSGAYGEDRYHRRDLKDILN